MSYEEARDAINTVYKYVDTIDELIAVVLNGDELITAINMLRELPVNVLQRLADPNSG